ncbi:MAG: hypothetical protein E3J72_06565 [Planctomycetota bacterium]|nr:MAG: hypothetical protein E3J72_06565 [Planctomycetota bacterium]
MFPQIEILRSFLLELEAASDSEIGRWRASLETPPPAGEGPPLALFVAKDMLEKLEALEGRKDLDHPQYEFLIASLENYCKSLGGELVWKLPANATPGDIPDSETVERFSSLPAGKIIGLVGRGIRFKDVVIKPPQIAVSMGPGRPLEIYADRINTIFTRYGMENLAVPAAFFEMQQASEEGKAPPVASLLGAIFAVLEKFNMPRPAHDELENIIESDLLPYLANDAAAGVELFPKPGTLPSANELSGSDYEVNYEADASRPSGSVKEVPRRGVRVNGETLRLAAVTVVRPGLLEPDPVTPGQETRKIGSSRVPVPDPDQPAPETDGETDDEPEPKPEAPPEAEKPDESTDKEPEPAAGTDPITVLVAGLLPLRESVKKHSVPLPAKTLTFIGKSQTMIAQLSTVDREGDPGLQFLVKIVDALDALRNDIPPGFGPFVDEVDGASGKITSFLESHGILVFPATGRLSRDELDRFGGENRSYVVRMGYSRAPQGEIFELIRRGLKREDKILRRAEVRVSAGSGPRIYRLLAAALEAVKSEIGGAGSKRRLYGKAFADLRSYFQQVENADAEKETTLARYAVNSLHELEGGPATLKAEKNLVKFLTDEGFTEILAMVNRPFDRSYPPSKYERKKVASDLPENHIVKVLRRGFLDRKGIPVQKALLAVSM